MTKINPYLTFHGNCEEAFNFYKSIFGGEFLFLGRFKDMSQFEGQFDATGEAEKIMHVSLPISNENILMGCDSFKNFNQQETEIGNNFSIHIHADSETEADRLYNGLSAGGIQTMTPGKTFWSAYFGMLTDQFGIQWMIGT